MSHTSLSLQRYTQTICVLKYCRKVGKFYKPKIVLNYWTLGVLVEQGKPATLAAVETPVFKVFLWIIIVPQHDVTSLRLPPCLCAVLKTVDVSLNLSR